MTRHDKNITMKMESSFLSCYVSSQVRAIIKIAGQITVTITMVFST